MTKKNLFYNVVFVSAILLLIVLLAAIFKYYIGNESVYTTIRDFYPIFIAVSGAYLAYCFQRRQAFLSSLRDLWEKIIVAKADIIEYSHNPNADQVAFGAAHRSISQAIDSVRAVYLNVGETSLVIGLYPLEQLHDMRIALDDIGFLDVTTEKRLAGRKAVIQAWNSFRFAFLREFPRAYAPHPVTQRGSRDPRR